MPAPNYTKRDKKLPRNIKYLQNRTNTDMVISSFLVLDGSNESRGANPVERRFDIEYSRVNPVERRFDIEYSRVNTPRDAETKKAVPHRAEQP
jgi:hypothetical protein